MLHRWKRHLAPLAMIGLIVGASGCSTGQSTASCYPGDRTSCTCGGGAQGWKTCGSDGQLSACACGDAGTGGGTGTGGETTSTTNSGSGPSSGSSSSSSSSGSGGADGGTDGGLLPFMSTCSTNMQCASGLCFDFPSRGPHCTTMCTTDAECPAPSPGCNPQGVCRAP